MSNLVFLEITGPGIQALEYARKAGHTTTLVCSTTYDFFMSPAQRRQARQLADVCVDVDDPRDTDAVLRALKATGVTAGRVDALLTVLHMCTVPAAELARTLGVPGTAPEAIATAKDKGRCRQALSDHGIPNLRFAVVSSAAEAAVAAEEIGYPVIVKPSTGMGKVATLLAQSRADIQAHFAEAAAQVATLEKGISSELDERYIIEELAVGELVSVEVLGDGGGHTPLVVVRRKTGAVNPVLELGSTVPSGLGAAAEEDLGAYATDVCRALGLDFGLFHVEIIHTAAGPRLVEVNPRIAGGAIPDLVRAATGRNLFEILVDLHTGAPLPDRPLPPVAGASHSFLAAADDCTVRSDLPADWFEAFRPRIHSGWSSVEPGARLRRMDGNFDVYGVVRIVAGSAAEAELSCARLTAEIADTLGVRLPPIAPFEPRS